MSDPSVERLWSEFRARNHDAPEHPSAVFHFCDNADDAATCLALVLEGKKRATAASLAELELFGHPIPQVGDYSVITDFDGTARAIVRTTGVEIKAFDEVDAGFAREEGEGDGSLEWWRKAHIAYYKRVLGSRGITVDGSLQIACEKFELAGTAH